MDSNLQFRSRWATVSWVRPSWGRSPAHRSSEQLRAGWADRLLEKLIKIGAKVISHGRYITFQTAEVAVPPQMFAEILSLIARRQAPPAPA